jgi:hypothetical protein
MRARLSYANVVATIALFVALGGSSYAALKLPRNSVGPAQIRSGAVQSRHLAPAVKSALGGKVYFAAIGAGGKQVRGDATGGGLEGTGHYEVAFPQSVASCAFTATLGGTDTTDVPAGRITVHQDGDRVGVQTWDAAGSAASLPFHVIVAC